jgi:hypothetical protein
MRLHNCCIVAFWQRWAKPVCDAVIQAELAQWHNPVTIVTSRPMAGAFCRSSRPARAPWARLRRFVVSDWAGDKLGAKLVRAVRLAMDITV